MHFLYTVCTISLCCQRTANEYWLANLGGWWAQNRVIVDFILFPTDLLGLFDTETEKRVRNDNQVVDGWKTPPWYARFVCSLFCLNETIEPRQTRGWSSPDCGHWEIKPDNKARARGNRNSYAQHKETKIRSIFRASFSSLWKENANSGESAIQP